MPETSTGPVELSVVIPCLDEANSIAICIKKALSAMQRDGISGEVVISDNGSTDGSQKIAAEAGARVVDCPIRGYGAALQWGFKAARGKYLIMGDADDSYDFDQLKPFVDRLRAGEKFVMGSRLRGKIEPGAMPTLNRHLGTPVLTWILNRLFATNISDCNCGIRVRDGGAGRHRGRPDHRDPHRLLQGQAGPGPPPSPLARRLAASPLAPLARP
jgi:glycosyltransferase involved in cell wall biosynthesis